MKERIKRFAPWVGYPAFYFVCLVLFATITFPYDRLRDRIVAQFNAAQRTSSSPQQLSIEELDSSFLTGIRARGIKLSQPAAEAGKPPVEIKIDQAKARISLLSLLVGKKSISYALDVAEGTVNGSYEESGKDRAVEVNFDGVDLSKLDVLTAQLGVPIEGHIVGTIKLALPEGKASKGNGQVNLEIKDVAIGDGKAKIKGLLALPKLSLGAVTLNGEAKDGVLKITKLSASGKDVDLNADGRVQFRELATDSSLDLSLKFKIGDSYRRKNEQTKTIFGEPGSKIPPLFDSVTQLKQGADGFYTLRVSGTLGNPKPVVGGSSPFGSAASPRSFGGSP